MRTASSGCTRCSVTRRVFPSGFLIRSNISRCCSLDVRFRTGSGGFCCVCPAIRGYPLNATSSSFSSVRQPRTNRRWRVSCQLIVVARWFSSWTWSRQSSLRSCVRAGRNNPRRSHRVTDDPSPIQVSPPATDAPSIFISYMREDAAAARRLYEAITSLGGDVWLDEQRLRPGDAWEPEILTAIRGTVRLFVPIVSANTEREEEGYVFKEWNEAVERARGIPRRRFIVPVIVDEDYQGDPTRYRTIPPAFRDFHFGSAPAGEPDAGLLDDADRRDPCHAARPRGLTRGATAMQLDDANPWPGLESFEEDSHAFFFGRDREIQSLSKHVREAPVTVLYGQSGLGKTSLLRAGLFPVLREHDFLPVRVRFEFKADCGATDTSAPSVCARFHPRGCARRGAAVGGGIAVGVSASR